ncbi:MAG TPA: VOC family protein [Armatimonadota bacterium]|jgi:hypothetical protein
MDSNRVVHFEIPAEAPEKLTEFYRGLFGWRIDKAPVPEVEYWLCDTGDSQPGINGGIMRRQNPQQPVMNYVGVASVDAALEKALSLGATVAMGKMPVSDMGFAAAIIDPQGNLCGLFEPA